MRVQIKELIQKEWRNLPIENIKGTTIIRYLTEKTHPIVAAIYDKSDEPIAFVANQQEYVDKYKEKGFTFLASELHALLGTEIIPAVIAYTFPESNIVEIKTYQQDSLL